MIAQQEVYAAVVERGYREGWTAEQFAARQVAKLQEELGELNHTIRQGHAVSTAIDEAAHTAQKHFDHWEHWGLTFVGFPKRAQQELADIQVVVFSLAAAIAEITGEPFDVVEAAREKATADVERGVR
jgi:NTP pyrophosphatase (non-canonical NTP hydrolase)